MTDRNGTLLQEMSYDAWGRLRNPNTLVAYLPEMEPELLLGRGYTGHEHLTMFGLVNMNARSGGRTLPESGSLCASSGFHTKL